LLEDDTGRIKASLWEDQIEKANVGDKVKISGAYVTEFRGELQIKHPKKRKD
jgi:ssDNA-binding replication factor A large subunit